MLSWQRMLSNADGKPRFVQWKTDAEAFWAIIRLLKGLEIQGQAQSQTIIALSGTAEEATQLLWAKRQDTSWAKNKTSGI